MTDTQLLLRLGPGLPTSCGQRQPTRIHPRRLRCRACHSGLIPALCPPATRALGCHLPKPGDVTGKECGEWGQVRDAPGEGPVPLLRQVRLLETMWQLSLLPHPLTHPTVALGVSLSCR